MIDIESIYRKLTNVDISEQKLLWDERGRGYYGEFLVFCELYPKLSGNCKILMNINIPSASGKMTEIDLLLIHETGLYVFEMKHYKGTIYGKPHEPTWTQYFRTAANQHFRNPIIQNQYHIDALRKIAPDIPVHSFVVFTHEECNLKVECNEPDVTVCTLSSLWHYLNELTARPPFLNMDCINHLFCTLLNYSPTTQRPVVVDGKELPFYEFISAISANYADKVQQLETDCCVKIERAQEEYNFEKIRAKNAIKTSKICTIIMTLVCIGMSVALCLSYRKHSREQIAAAQRELAAFAQKFEEVKEFNYGELNISKELVTASNVVLEPSSDIENAISFSCSLVWNGDDYGVSIGEDAVLIVILNDGSIKEYPVYNERYPYSSDFRLGKPNGAWYLAHSNGSILPHDFYDIVISDISYIKLSNIDVWTDVNHHPKIITSGYEIELYKAE